LLFDDGEVEIVRKKKTNCCRTYCSDNIKNCL